MAEGAELAQPVDMTSEPGQRPHPQGDGTFAVRMLRGQDRRRVLRFDVTTGTEEQLDPALDGVGTQPFETVGGGSQDVQRGDVAEGRPAPQTEGGLHGGERARPAWRRDAVSSRSKRRPSIASGGQARRYPTRR